MTKKRPENESQSYKLDLMKIYEICESHGISKQVITCFIKYKMGVPYE